MTWRSFLHRMADSTLFRWAIGLTVAGISLFLAAGDVPLGEALAVLRQADPLPLWLGLAAVALNHLSKAFRWQVLLGAEGEKPGLWALLLSLLAGQMFNWVYPGRVGDLHRIYVIGGMGAGRAFTLGTVALEKLIDLLAYAGLLGILALAIPLPDWLSQPAAAGLWLALLLVLLLVLFTARRSWLEALLEWAVRRLPVAWRPAAASRGHAALSSLDVLRSPRARAAVALWTAVIWVTNVLINYSVMLALRIEAPFVAALLILAALQVGIAVPSSPGRLGVFEYACRLALLVYRVDAAAALGYGVLLHLLVMAPVIVSGLIAFWLLNDLRRPVVAPPLEGPR